MKHEPRLIALVLALCVLKGVVRTEGAHNRRLLQTPCPAGCWPDRCVQSGTGSDRICTRCVYGLLLVRGQCACGAGKYYTRTSGTVPDVYNNTPACTTCNAGYFCVGGVITSPSANVPAQTSCASLSSGLTTTVKGATSRFWCQERGGWGYRLVGGQPTAVRCFNDTYNEGFKKQECQSCPPGYQINDPDKATNPAASRHDSSTDCVAPPGYYQRNPTEAAQCPQGEYQPNFNRAWRCLRCPLGTTTQPNRLYTDIEFCNTLRPGYFTTSLQPIARLTQADTGNTHYMNESAITCPQNHWCPGGVPTQPYTDTNTLPATGTLVRRCSAEYGLVAGTNSAPLWTKERGAESRDQCLVPPGHGLSSSAVVPCAPGQFQELWISAVNASTPACQSCADDPYGAVTSTPTVALAIYPNLTTEDDVQYIEVFGSAMACRMDPGYGMIKTARGFLVQPCSNNSYGNNEYTYGQGLRPCNSCPTRLVTTDLASATEFKNDNGTGFTDMKACVTRTGFGWNGRESTQCAIGTYNPGHNRDECRECGWGYTTADDPSMQATADDCKVTEGFQSVGGVVQECPQGTYSDSVKAAGVPCTSCPNNTWTNDIQSTAATDCEACKPGYGKPSSADYTTPCTDCSTVVINGRTLAGYGPLTREGTDCSLCPYQETGFAFIYGGDLQQFAAKSVIKPGQTSATGCVSEFAQIESGVWFMGGANVANAAATIEACATACSDDCMFFSFDYKNSSCWLAIYSQPGSPVELVAFKAMPAGDVMAFTKAEDGVKTKAVPSGLYTQWPMTTAQASSIGVTDAAVNTISKLECLVACNNDPLCAGVRMANGTVGADAISSCYMVKGISDAGTLTGMQKLSHRTLTHAVVSRLS